MAVPAYVGNASAGGTSPLAPAWPVGAPAANQIALLWVLTKPNTATVNTPSGWTLAGSESGGQAGETQGIDTGNTKLTLFTRELAGGEAAPSVTTSGVNSGFAWITVYSKTAGAAWDVSALSTGVDTTHGTARSATGGTAIPLAIDDRVLAAFGLDTDATTAYTTPTLTATGITFGAGAFRRNAGGTNTGNDSGAAMFDSAVTAGSATVAPTASLSAGPSSCGPTIIVRLREVAGTQTLVPPIITSTAAVNTPAISVGAVELAPPSVASTEVVRTPTVALVGSDPALLAEAKANGNSTFSTAAIDTTGASLLLVTFSDNGNAATLSDSKGNTWLTAKKYNPFGPAITIAFAWNPTVGTGHTITLTGTGFAGAAEFQAWSNIDTTANPLDQTNGNHAFGSPTVQPGSVTPTSAGQLIVAAVNVDNAGGATTVNSGFRTPAYGDPGSGGVYMGCVTSHLVQATAAAVNPTFTSPNSPNQYAAIATFKPAAGGGPGAQTLAPPAIGSTAVVRTPTVSVGAVAVYPPMILSQEQVFIESFNKADGAMGPDQTWTHHVFAGADMVVSGNQAVFSTSGTGSFEDVALTSGIPQDGDQIVSIDVTNISVTGTDRWVSGGPLARIELFGDPETYRGYACEIGRQDQALPGFDLCTIIIWRVDDGLAQVVTNLAAQGTAPANIQFPGRLTLAVIGDKIHAWYTNPGQATPVISVSATDATYTRGRVGLGAGHVLTADTGSISFDNWQARIGVEAVNPPTVQPVNTLVPPSIASTATVNSPSVSVGSVTIAPPALTSTVVVRQPTVSVGAVTLVPGSVPSQAVVRTPTVSVGAIALAPPLIGSTAVVRTPTVSVAAVGLAPPTIASTAVARTPTITVGPVAVAPPSVASTSVVRTPTVNVEGGPQALQPTTIPSGSVVRAPSVSPAPWDLVPPAIVSTVVIGNPTVVVGAVSLEPPTVETTAVVRSPAVGASDSSALQPPKIESTSVVRTPWVYDPVNLPTFTGVRLSTVRVDPLRDTNRIDSVRRTIRVDPERTTEAIS